MATLKGEVKAFIVQSLACFDTPSQVVELVKKEFGLSITRQQVESHDPTKANGRGLAQKWVELFHETRKRFQTELSDIPIANKAYRLRVLDRMAMRAEGMKNLALTAEIIEQAAKECGDAYTNKHKFEHSGPNGGAIQTITMSKEEYKSARQEMMEDDDC
ncbi:DUF2280 domain-containing protein [Salmonella enterica subsp. enterica serovar Larochelle]|uniref:DUF2280 domain-containing protein n=1 Tax=Salmonella enterica TaxID=28901 RepID=UPI000F977F72|nr:DUF2280 domain-containing protein [Salmonella enterica subsp. enterica serovar Larochelle]EBI8378792.1 DUF2280 domain-containing protein [Salmonella enterica]MIP72719.1 DUF2280 domain-containing protein [Salmonella enterica subsp. enterica]EBH8758711.1 DUF2280 domain-containing protein [Salmonella enterica subsp. enterica serovar Larochelle]EBW4662927.1 DUF2280 domain-containing protein [Salmonella enterica subsp. enterica serovar Larochelle]